MVRRLAWILESRMLSWELLRESAAKAEGSDREAAAVVAAGEGEDDGVGEARVGGEEEEVVPAVAGAQGRAG